MIIRKTAEEIELMREGGRITAEVLREVSAAAGPGVTLLELEKIAADGIARRGGSPAFQRVEDYKFVTCLNVNEGIVHGIPTARKLAEEDILSVDLGTYYKGFNTDASWTVYVGNREQASAPKIKFLEAGERALDLSISQAQVGNHIGDISSAMQRVLEQNGYSPVTTLVGHGVGKDLHEDPQIPCLALPNRGSKLLEGMTLAIEVIYTEGSPELGVAKDGWTIETRDRSLGGLFEKTIAVTKDGPITLT